MSPSTTNPTVLIYRMAHINVSVFFQATFHTFSVPISLIHHFVDFRLVEGQGIEVGKFHPLHNHRLAHEKSYVVGSLLAMVSVDVG